jgi:excisionase family DNA binding protein
MNIQTSPICFSVKEAARVSGLSRSWIYERLAAGELESRKIGRRRLIVAASLSKLLNVQSV